MDLSVNKVITTIYSIHKLQTDRNRKNILKLLGQLNNEMMKKLPHTVKVKVLFHQDRARVHKYIVVVMKCENLGYGVFPLQSYSADLAFCVNWETSKNGPEEEILLQRRSPRSNKRLFQKPRQILFQGGQKILETL